MAEPVYSLNQAFPILVKGQIVSGYNSNQLSVQINPSSVGTFVGGTAVKLIDGTQKIPVVDVAAATDDIYGFVTYSIKDNTPAAGDIINLAIGNTVMAMQASAAIVRGAKVEIVASGAKVATSAGTNKIVGIALDKASAADDLIRVQILAPLVAQV